MKGWELGWDALAAVGTLAAVLVSLYLARRETTHRHRDEARRAKAMAEPLCDELRAIHWRLSKLPDLASRTDIGNAIDDFDRHVAAMMTPVFDRFSNDVQAFDGTTAALALRAYGNLIRTRDLLARRRPAPLGSPASTGVVYMQFLKGMPVIVEPVLTRVEEAVRAMWKYTPHAGNDPFGRTAEGAGE